MEIIYAGASHHGIYGYQSLWGKFEKIYLLDESSSSVLSMKREQDSMISDFDDVECPFVFLCGYGKFISDEQLEKKIYINLHESLLPKYRGMQPIFYAIANGDTELGISMHLVDKWMDAGDILAQFAFPYNGERVIDVKKMIDIYVLKYAGTICYDYMSGRINAIPQDHNKATYGALRNLNDCLISFYDDNEYLRNFFHALTYDYPFPRIHVRNSLYEVIDIPKVINREYYGPIGRVVNKDDSGTWVKSREGFVIFNRVRCVENGDVKLLAEIVPLGYRFIIKGNE